MKLIIRFSKREHAVFTSHLDTVRIFIRALRRCGVKMRYTEGFNPHPRVYFASPLPLGYLSDGEYVEVDCDRIGLDMGERRIVDLRKEKKLIEDDVLSALRKDLSKELPQGFKILFLDEIKPIKYEKKLSKRITAEQYKILIESSDHNLLDKLNEYIKDSDREIEKKIEKKNIIKKIKISENIISFNMSKANPTDLFIFEKPEIGYDFEPHADRFTLVEMIINSSMSLNPSVLIADFKSVMKIEDMTHTILKTDSLEKLHGKLRSLG